MSEHISRAIAREASSLDDYANEVASPLTEAVLRGTANRLRALVVEQNGMLILASNQSLDEFKSHIVREVESTAPTPRPAHEEG